MAVLTCARFLDHTGLFPWAMTAGILAFVPSLFFDAVLPAAVPSGCAAAAGRVWGRFCSAWAAHIEGITPPPPPPPQPQPQPQSQPPQPPPPPQQQPQPQLQQRRPGAPTPLGQRVGGWVREGCAAGLAVLMLWANAEQLLPELTPRQPGPVQDSFLGHLVPMFGL